MMQNAWHTMVPQFKVWTVQDGSKNHSTLRSQNLQKVCISMICWEKKTLYIPFYRSFSSLPRFLLWTINTCGITFDSVSIFGHHLLQHQERSLVVQYHHRLHLLLALTKYYFYNHTNCLVNESTGLVYKCDVSDASNGVLNYIQYFSAKKVYIFITQLMFRELHLICPLH